MTRLAPDPITVILDGEVLMLRPSLLAAHRLNRREGGYKALATGVMEGDFAAMADLIGEATGRPDIILMLMREAAVSGTDVISALHEPLCEFLAQLVGVDTAQPASPTGKATPAENPITRTEYLDKLFQIGSGVMGWTPAETWAATPAEIEAAYNGRLDLLKAILGTGDTPSRNSSIPFSQKVKATMQALGGKVVKRPKVNA